MFTGAAKWGREYRSWRRKSERCSWPLENDLGYNADRAEKFAWPHASHWYRGM